MQKKSLTHPRLLPNTTHNCSLLPWGSRRIYNFACVDAPVAPLEHPGELYEAFPQCRADRHQGSSHKRFSVSLEVFVAEQPLDKSFFSPSTNIVVIQGQKLSQAAGVQPVLLSKTERIIVWISILHLLDCKLYRLCKRLQESILFLLSTMNLLRKQQTVRGLVFMHKQGKCIPQMHTQPSLQGPRHTQ